MFYSCVSICWLPVFFYTFAFVAQLQRVLVLIKMHLFPTDVRKELDGLSKTTKNFEARVGFAKNLETLSAVRYISASSLTHQMLRNT